MSPEVYAKLLGSDPWVHLSQRAFVQSSAQ